MPEVRTSDSAKDLCPRCGTALIQFVVLSGGRRQHCRICGLLRDADSVPRAHPDSSESVDRSHLLCYAQAVLQTVRLTLLCRRCQAHLSPLRLIADQLEQQRAAYAQAPLQGNEGSIDAFLHEMTERLQGGTGHLCYVCRQHMEFLTWERFVSLLLEGGEPKEP